MDAGDSQKAVSQEAITSQHAMKTQNPAYRTSNVAVFAPVGADRADIANAVHRGDFFMKLKSIRELFETITEIGSATHLMSQLSWNPSGNPSGIVSFGIGILKCYAFGAILHNITIVIYNV